MASAADSGCDTGNDSNDSSVQFGSKYSPYVSVLLQKLPGENLGNVIPNKASSADNANETNPREELHLGNEQDTNEVMSTEPMTDANFNMSMPNLESSTSNREPRRHREGDNQHIARRIMDIWNQRCLVNNVTDKLLSTSYEGNRLVRKATSSSSIGKARSDRDLVLKCGSHHSAHLDLLSYKADLDVRRMFRAASHNDVQRVRDLLEQGVNPNKRDRFKRTPLHLAACMGYTDIVKLLLDHGADPNLKDKIGNTPLHLAACTNHVSVITLLLKAGTQLSEDMLGHSPLQLAITKFNIMKRSTLPHPTLKYQVCQVISMLSEYMRQKQAPSIDPELLNKFETMVRVSDNSEQIENNLQDLLSSLGSLSLSPSTSQS